MSDTQQTQLTKTTDEMEREAYGSITSLNRQGALWSLILAAVAMGIGTESVWIGVGTFLALFYLSSSLGIAMTMHRYLTKPKV